MDRYFKEEVYPVLTPMAVDSSRPFPLVRNKSLNIAALLRKKEGDRELEFAMVQVPSVLPRIVVLPETERPDGSRLRHVILLEEVIDTFAMIPTVSFPTTVIIVLSVVFSIVFSRICALLSQNYGHKKILSRDFITQ